MDETQFLKDRYKAQQAIISIGDELATLSLHFFTTGNTEMAEKMYEIAKGLLDNLRIHDAAFDDLFNRYIAAVDQGSKNMMDMALALSNLAGGEE